MNNSQRTTEIAHGIYLWAVLQNLPMSVSTDPNRKENKAWRKWCNNHSKIEIETVYSEQFKLFDRCNSKDWK